MVRSSYLCALLIFVSPVVITAADAQTNVATPSVADLLRREPISLMDWGLMRANQDIKKAVKELNEELREDAKARESIEEYKRQHPEGHFKPLDTNSLGLRQFDYDYTMGDAEWSYREERILIQVAAEPLQNYGELRAADAFITADACADLLHDVRTSLLYIGGIVARNLPDSVTAQLAARLATRWFFPPSHLFPASSFPAPERIADITMLQVVLSLFGKTLENTSPSPGEDWQLGARPYIACTQPLSGGSISIRDDRQSAATPSSTH